MRLPFTLLTFMIAMGSIAQITFSEDTGVITPGLFGTHAMGVTDMDDNGLDDIIILDGGNHLYVFLQETDGSYTEIDHGTIGPGGQFGFYAWGLCVADVDGNGKRDVFAGGAYDGLQVAEFSNDASNFDVSQIPGVFVFLQGANFIDINRDGNIDIYACHDDGESAVLYGNGSGTFTVNYNDLPTALYGGGENDSGNYGSVWSDVNNDGLPDLYVSKCRQGVGSSTDPRRINQLWLANADGSYTEAAAAAGIADGAQSWSADFGDIDNDGDMDLFIGNHTNISRLMLNNGDGTFSEISNESGIATMMNFLVIQSTFRDFDNDGWIDLLVTGGGNIALARNNGDNTFTDVSGAFNYSINSYGLGDLNNDGFVDIAATSGGYGGFGNQEDKVFINDGNDNNWIAFDLTGTVSNIDAIGARIEIAGPFGIQIREVRAGESYGIANSLIAHFGLGDGTIVESVTIQWPSGAVQQIFAPAINTVNEVTEEDTGVSVAEVNATLEFNIFPNPATEQVQITAEELRDQNIEFRVIDAQGRILIRESILGFQGNALIPVGTLAAGTYVMEVLGEKGRSTMSFVKQ